MWLYADNRVAEAEQIIRNAAKLNNITVPDKILVQPDTEDSDKDGKKSDDNSRKKRGKLLNNFHDQNNSRRSKKTKDRSAHYTVFDVFRNRHLTINICCIAFLRLVKLFLLTT